MNLNEIEKFLRTKKYQITQNGKTISFIQKLKNYEFIVSIGFVDNFLKFTISEKSLVETFLKNDLPQNTCLWENLLKCNKTLSIGTWVMEEIGDTNKKNIVKLEYKIPPITTEQLSVLSIDEILELLIGEMYYKIDSLKRYFIESENI